MTTKELRKKDLELIVAPNAAGEAFGQLYLDDGESLKSSWSFIKFVFKDQTLSWSGQFGYTTDKIARIKVLGVKEEPKGVNAGEISYDKSTSILEISFGQPLNNASEVKFHN